MTCVGRSIPMEDDLWDLRKICDNYYEDHPRILRPGGARTHVNIGDTVFDVNRGAKLTLDFYNRENQKNFNLVKVAKLNSTYACNYMIVCAQDDESDECCLFRCIFNVVKEEAEFCEIKRDGGISNLVDNVDDYVKKLRQRDDCRPFDTCKNDLRDGSTLGSDGVLHVSSTIFRILGEKSFSDLHKMCEDYLDPCLYNKCGTMTCMDVKCFDWVTEYAKLAINVYNKKEQKNFTLIKVEKLYSLFDPNYFCMTFWARNSRSDEYRLFRAVVCLKGDELSPNMSDDHKYLPPVGWDLDAVMKYYSAISCSGNTSDGKNDLGVGSAGGSVGSDSGSTIGSGGDEESLKL